jgi:hypothetical protein
VDEGEAVHDQCQPRCGEAQAGDGQAGACRQLLGCPSPPARHKSIPVHPPGFRLCLKQSASQGQQQTEREFAARARSELLQRDLDLLGLNTAGASATAANSRKCSGWAKWGTGACMEWSPMTTWPFANKNATNAAGTAAKGPSRLTRRQRSCTGCAGITQHVNIPIQIYWERTQNLDDLPMKLTLVAHQRFTVCLGRSTCHADVMTATACCRRSLLAGSTSSHSCSTATCKQQGAMRRCSSRACQH